MTDNNRPPAWLKIITLKYQSTKGVSFEKFEEMISAISKKIGEEVINQEGDYIFRFKMDGINCMCGIVLLNKDPITECQFAVLTNEGRKPQDMSGIEPVHYLIETFFLK